MSRHPRGDAPPAGFTEDDWCDWCQSWHAPQFKYCHRETGEPIPEEGWWLL